MRSLWRGIVAGRSLCSNISALFRRADPAIFGVASPLPCCEVGTYQQDCSPSLSLRSSRQDERLDDWCYCPSFACVDDIIVD